MYERHNQKLATRKVFYQRVRRHFLIAMGIMTFCLCIGVLGYHYSSAIPWLDSLHNASMILSGMGPVVEIKTVAGKWFSSFYALFSGIVFYYEYWCHTYACPAQDASPVPPGEVIFFKK